MAVNALDVKCFILLYRAVLSSTLSASMATLPMCTVIQVCMDSTFRAKRYQAALFGKWFE